MTAQMSRTHHYAVPRNRSALAMTETELGLSASAAIVADSSRDLKVRKSAFGPNPAVPKSQYMGQCCSSSK